MGSGDRKIYQKNKKTGFLESISRKKRSSQKKQEKQGWNKTCELEFEEIDGEIGNLENLVLVELNFRKMEFGQITIRKIEFRKKEK